MGDYLQIKHIKIMKKRIFITGASSGLGKAAAILFASKGWNVLATMRNPQKEEELKKLKHHITSIRRYRYCSN